MSKSPKIESELNLTEIERNERKISANSTEIKDAKVIRERLVGYFFSSS